MNGAPLALALDWRLTTDAARVHALHSSVIAQLPAGMVRPDPISHFETNMGEQGQTLGCFLDDGTLVAYGVVGLRSHNVSHVAQLVDADLARFCVLDGAASLPEWRGYGLHLSVIDERIRHAGLIGRSQVGATVAPENIRSLRGLFHAGMEVHNFATLYGGLARLVMCRDLRLGARRWEGVQSVATRDADGHRAALARGLRGFACSQCADGSWQIDYGIAA